MHGDFSPHRWRLPPEISRAPRSARGRLSCRVEAFWTAAALLFTAIAVLWFAVPLGRDFGGAILGSSMPPGGADDPILNAAILEWGRRTLFSHSLRVFDFPAGFPLRNTLASTENLLGWQLFYTPLRAAGMGVIASYNVLLLCSFVISGLGMARLARQLGAGEAGALVAGMGFAFLPLHLFDMIHLQTMAVCWLPWAFYYLERFLASRSPRDVIGLTAFSVLTLLSGINVALYLALFLSAYLILRLVAQRRWLSWRDIAALAFGMVGGLAIIAPVVMHYVRFNSAHGLSHPVAEIMNYSNSLSAFLRAPVWQSIWSGTSLTRDVSGIPSLPSIVLVLLMLVYLWKTRRDSERRSVAAVLVILIGMGVVLSLGPILKIRGNYPSTIARWVPLPGRLLLRVSALRHPFRLVLFAYAFLALLAGLGATAIAEGLPKGLRVPVMLVVLSLLFVEFRPDATLAGESVRVSEPLLGSDAYPLLANEPDRGAVVEWPWARRDGSRDESAMSRYVYGSAGHLRRIVAYRKTVALAAPDSLQAAADALPDDDRRMTLWDAGVTRLVIHRLGARAAESERRITALREAAYPTLHDGAESVAFSLAPPLR